MNEKQLIEIRNDLHLIENQLNRLRKYAFNGTVLKAAYHSGILQDMITLLGESTIELQRLSDLKNANMDTSNQGPEAGQIPETYR
ncbi:hypothetical protein FEM33_19095 [Dyadobacter flavalbus]|uniref:Uncharacterized protein n=1 Tax=Dyadobacter flavalbus TaxID=2579942 RepID=A0A5M8QRS3_9BACT|nr:hypothetical protein [Dyadobacter flavalbus]KAA6437911.1 hypothetical protein FEM33_19095 [Dyadobacter flavalbus]